MTDSRQVVWTPSKEYAQESNLRRFMDAHEIADYEELLDRAKSNFVWFWDAFIEFAGLEFYQPYEKTVDLSRGIPWATWFLGGKINLVHNFLDKWATDPAIADRQALIWEGEDGATRRLTFAALYGEVNRAANVLKDLGVAKGDRVAIYMPVLAETVIALYAIYKIGAIAVPLFSGFGPEAVALRLNDVEAKVVVTADEFLRGGRKIPLKPTLDVALETVASVQAVLVVARGLGERAGETPNLADPVAIAMTPGRDHLWQTLVDTAAAECATERMDPEDPCMVSYSSGTTGSPKGIVHVHGGIAVKTAETGVFVYDTRPDDVSFMITDFGWMMGQLPLFSAHAVGAALVIYEGSPMYPTPGRLYELIEKYRISSFGAPATALRLLKTYAEPFRVRADLSSLRILGHTGEPIDEDTWNWYLALTGGRAPIMNGSGGTEVFAEILASTVMHSLKPCCLGETPAVGPMVVDEQGQPVPKGGSGYLVFTLPQPAQTRGFWKNPQKYLDTYFPLGKELWWQGDMVRVDEDGFWFHLGRADDVIKVSGRRTGPGEIEDVLNAHPGVFESAVIGVPHPVKGSEIVAFVVANPGVQGAQVEEAELISRVADALGRPYEPGAVHTVKELPKTRTQKIVRRLIKQRYLGEPLGDTSSVMNPDVIGNLPTRA